MADKKFLCNLDLVGSALKNVTLNANEGNNAISNLEVEDFASSALTSDLSASALSTQFATADAVVAYVASLTGGNPIDFKGGIDASTNPNYPAADSGHQYIITVAGRIGGASGPVVQAGDVVLCTTDSTATGDHATVGSNWTIAQANVDQATETVLGLMTLATTSEANGNTGDKALTPANTGNIMRWGEKAGQTGTTGTVSIPSGATVLQCLAQDRGEIVELGWDVDIGNTTLTWTSEDPAFSGSVILGYVYDMATLS